ncbi:hypothetical protein PR202_ga22111 [Eleusine coracana subsp. coracana]|uniref:Secreted protein n=1 Tax=Eleusine coracana subsp. coracana TaxID=191504 RepID=A0AAV5D330_ELECO|nr:hypothetical protein PR202_ga22111 [Eleusine coracana subsp. coracana]
MGVRGAATKLHISPSTASDQRPAFLPFIAVLLSWPPTSSVSGSTAASPPDPILCRLHIACTTTTTLDQRPALNFPPFSLS